MTATVTVYVWWRYYDLWRALELGAAPYFVLQTALFVNMVFCLHSCGRLPDGFWGRTLLFTASEYFIVLYYSAPFFFARDAALLLWRRFAPASAAASFLADPRSGLIVLAAAVLLAAACYVNMGVLRKTHYAISIKKTCGRQKLRVAMIADAHVGNGLAVSALGKVADMVNAETPDLVLMLGDIFDENTSVRAMAKTRAAFLRLKAKDGVWGVLGTHERYAGSSAQEYLKQAGVRLLADEAAVISGGVLLAGRKDVSAAPKPLEDILPADSKDMAVIVMSHQPQSLIQLARAGANTALCGAHARRTVPLYVSAVRHGERHGPRRQKIRRDDGSHQRGVGGWGLHAKFPAKSEIVILDITFGT